MRIALFNTFSPFVRGGAEVLVDDLYNQLEKRGHSVTLFRIPFPNDYETGLMKTVFAAESLDFDAYDMVIAFKFPAYCVVHRKKVLWFFHQFRQVYDLFGKEYGLQDDALGNALKKIICSIDIGAFNSSYFVSSIANEVTKRTLRYNKCQSEVIYPPVNDTSVFRCDEYGDYVFYPSRITELKRQELLINAMSYVKSNVKLIIAGKCDEESYINHLNKIISDNNLEKKVTIKNSWISEEEKISLYAKSLAVAFIPFEEDYGFITLEAFYSSKPVITCKDSGGPTEFVTEMENGFSSDANPQALAECMDKLYNDKKLAEKMGKAAYQSILNKKITWDETIRRLLCD